ncbi:hypothetical protein BT67DRAFT_441753 [Trichocladium antarcticum]|uniref:Uncharacterized protein n=1 Tax=Trichocladium antarcticum TaxID=1450529 RepID=A0AAN6ZEJ9_9PEZI|nr:hypothetical protein BT67DRAFT_441753 [Trichocladium antarcticum]
MVDKSMLSEKEKALARYLAEVHNLANKGIKSRGKGRKVERVPPPHPPHQQHQQLLQQSSPSTSPIGTTVYAAPYPMAPCSRAFPTTTTTPHNSYHREHTPPFTASAIRPPPTAMLFGCAGPALPFNTRDTAYAYNYHHDAYADQLSDASSLYGPTPVLYVKDEHGQELAFKDRLY